MKKKLNTASVINTASEVIETPKLVDIEPRPSGYEPQKRKRVNTEQLNVRVNEGLSKDLKMWAMAHGVNPADVIEQGFELMKAKYGA